MIEFKFVDNILKVKQPNKRFTQNFNIIVKLIFHAIYGETSTAKLYFSVMSSLRNTIHHIGGKYGKTTLPWSQRYSKNFLISCEEYNQQIFLDELHAYIIAEKLTRS